MTLGYGTSRDIEVSGNFFGPDIDTQQIDLEHGSFTNLVIRDNVFSKILGDDRDELAFVISSADQVQIYNNIIDGPVLFRDASNVDMRDNVGISQLTVDLNSFDILVRDNEFDLDINNWGTPRRFAGIYLRSLLGVSPNRVTIKDNVIHSANNSTLIRVIDANNVTIENNSFVIDDNVADMLWITARAIDIHAFVNGNSVSTSADSPGSSLTTRIQETRGNQIVVH